jgi:hypothetical protein
LPNTVGARRRIEAQRQQLAKLSDLAAAVDAGARLVVDRERGSRLVALSLAGELAEGAELLPFALG